MCFMKRELKKDASGKYTAESLDEGRTILSEIRDPKRLKKEMLSTMGKLSKCYAKQFDDDLNLTPMEQKNLQNSIDVNVGKLYDHVYDGLVNHANVYKEVLGDVDGPEIYESNVPIDSLPPYMPKARTRINQYQLDTFLDRRSDLAASAASITNNLAESLEYQGASFTTDNTIPVHKLPKNPIPDKYMPYIEEDTSLDELASTELNLHMLPYNELLSAYPTLDPSPARIRTHDLQGMVSTAKKEYSNEKARFIADKQAENELEL